MKSPHSAAPATQSLENPTEFSLRSLLDHASDAVARFDTQLRHVYVNAATARANNRPVEDFTGKTMRELGHSEETSELIESNLKKVFATGEETTFDVNFQGPWGTKYFQTRMTPENDAHGLTHHVISISRDLTTEHLAHQRLIENERFAAASRLAHELAHQINNPLQALRNTIYLLQNESPPYNNSERLQTADRLLQRIETTVRTILLLPEEAPDPQGTRALDNSLERARESFETSQKLLAMAEATEFPMTAIDMEGVITIWNEAATRVYGFSAREALGRPIVAVTAQGMDYEIAEVLRKVRAGEPIPPLDTERITRNGARVRMRLYLSPILDADGNAIGVSSTGTVVRSR